MQLPRAFVCGPLNETLYCRVLISPVFAGFLFYSRFSFALYVVFRAAVRVHARGNPAIHAMRESGRRSRRARGRTETQSVRVFETLRPLYKKKEISRPRLTFVKVEVFTSHVERTHVSQRGAPSPRPAAATTPTPRSAVSTVRDPASPRSKFALVTRCKTGTCAAALNMCGTPFSQRAWKHIEEALPKPSTASCDRPAVR